MTEDEVPSIVAADRLNHGLVIEFDNRRYAFYSASLLYAKFPEAEELDETEVAW